MIKETTQTENNIYMKLAEVQMELSKTQFNKTGVNKFGNFKYFELEDILPTIQKECYNQGLFLEFNFTNEEASLKIIDMKNPGAFITNVAPVPQIKELNSKMNVIQSLGAYMTYLKRYLLINSFLLCEASIIDSTELTEMNNQDKAEARKNARKSKTPKKPPANVRRTGAGNPKSEKKPAAGFVNPYRNKRTKQIPEGVFMMEGQ